MNEYMLLVKNRGELAKKTGFSYVRGAGIEVRPVKLSEKDLNIQKTLNGISLEFEPENDSSFLYL